MRVNNLTSIDSFANIRLEGVCALNTRVRQLRNMLHMSQNAFGKRLGVTAAGISKIESGDRKLTEQMLLMICREFGVNENWLRYGEGEILHRETFEGMDQLVQYYRLDELDQKIILEYARLDEKKRSIIKEYIMKIAQVDRMPDVLTDGEPSDRVQRCAEGSDNQY